MSQSTEGILMQAALHMETTILPGHRLEISDPQLPEGARVEVIVVLPEQKRPHWRSALEFLESLPPGPRAFKTWEEYEQHLREEKDSWER
jgi:hypothetical protein